VLCANVERDGGGDQEVLSKVCAVQRKVAPHVLLRQEATHSHRDDQLLLKLQAYWLGMVGFMGPARGDGLRPYSAVFLDPDLFPQITVHGQQDQWWLPPANVEVRLAGTDRPLALLSYHLTAHSVSDREQQADWMVTLLGKGLEVIAGGDSNSFPEPAGERVPVPDAREVATWSGPRQVHRARETAWGSGVWVADTEPDRRLRRGGYIEAGRLLGARGEDFAHALAATTRRPSRLDRFYLSPGVAEAAVDLRVIDAAGSSDHDWPLLFLRRDLLARVLSRA
jgi:hypothetical protein